MKQLFSDSEIKKLELAYIDSCFNGKVKEPKSFGREVAELANSKYSEIVPVLEKSKSGLKNSLAVLDAVFEEFPNLLKNETIAKSYIETQSALNSLNELLNEK